MLVRVRFPQFSGIGDGHQRRSDAVAEGVGHHRAEEGAARGALLGAEGAAVKPAERAGAVLVVPAHRLLRLAATPPVAPIAGPLELSTPTHPPTLPAPTTLTPARPP